MYGWQNENKNIISGFSRAYISVYLIDFTVHITYKNWKRKFNYMVQENTIFNKSPIML